MTRSYIAILASVAATASTTAQTVDGNFRLDLSLIARTGDPNVSIQDLQGPVTIQPGQTIRLETRYRIADLAADNVGSVGLAVATLHITNNVGSAAGSLGISQLTDYQADPIGSGYAYSTPPLNPDTTGAAGLRGLIGPFRGGLASDTSETNGRYYDASGGAHAGLTMAASGSFTDAIILAASGQNSYTGTAPSAANTNSNLTTWAIYSFDYTAAANFSGAVTFTVAPDSDPNTLNAFGFFSRSTSNPGISTFEVSKLYTAASITINVVPAPGTAVVLALAAPALVRRRR